VTAAPISAGLFDDEPLPHGLCYRPDFLTREEEEALLDWMPALPFKEALFQQYTARRRVVRFGALYDEDAAAWVDGPALPAELLPLRARAAAWLGVPPDAFVHVLTTEYQTGTPIGWHRDKAHYGMVVGISLGSACRMRFRPIDARGERARTIALDLAPRSAYVLRDDIRWRWQHHIPPTKALRYSITLRTRAVPGGTTQRETRFA
jgi:alkylated DNA repair dioxygenase AlkB